MSQSQIKVLIENNDWEEIKKTIASNQLDIENFNLVFENAKSHNQFELIKQLAEQKHCSTEDVDAALFDVCNKEQWQVLADLCTLTKGKQPSNQAISRALRVLFDYNQIELLKFLCKKVKSEALNLFLLSVSHAVSEVARNIIDYVCNLESYRSNTLLHNELLVEAAQNCQWALIKHLLQTEIKFSDQTLSTVLNIAINKNLIIGMQAFFNKQNVSQLKPEQVIQAIHKTIECKNASILNCFYQKLEIAPTTANQNLLNLAKLGNWEEVNKGFDSEQEQSITENLLRFNQKDLVKSPNGTQQSLDKSKVFLEILDTLTTNICKKENKRWTSGANSPKVKLLTNLKEEYLNKNDPKKNYAEELWKICQIKRHKINFLSQPHSVEEYKQLLKTKKLSIEDFAPLKSLEPKR